MDASMLQMVEAGTQIAFWAVAGTVGVKTYRHARNTLFQPARTEIFKRQLDLLSDALNELQGLNEIELRKKYGLNSTLELSALALMDDYAENRFRAKRPQAALDQEEAQIAYWQIPTELMGSRFVLVQSPMAPTKAAEGRVENVSSTKAPWKPPAKVILRISKDRADGEARLRRIRDNPLAPTPLIVLFDELLSHLDDALEIINASLVWAASQFPDRDRGARTGHRPRRAGIQL